MDKLNKDADGAYASFDTAFVQSDTMTDFKEKLIAKNNLSPNYQPEKISIASQVNSRLDNILHTNTSKKDKMDKNIDELVAIYEQGKSQCINDMPPIPNINMVKKISQENFNQTQPVSGNNTFFIILIIVIIVVVLYFLYKKFLAKTKN